MSDNNRGGGCGSFIFFILLVGAAFGFVEWETVGTFVRVSIYILLGIAGFFVVAYLLGNNE